MVELVTHPTTSSSIEFPIFKDSSVQGISSEQLAALIKRQIADESFVLVILDCRSGKDVTPVGFYIFSRLNNVVGSQQ